MGVVTARSPLNRLRRTCLALPDAWEKVSHGEPTFWVGKKMFATFAEQSKSPRRGARCSVVQGHTCHPGSLDCPLA